MKRADFDEVVRTALERIPNRFRDAMENVALTIQDRPGAEARSMGRGLYGLYVGVPLTEQRADDGCRLPDTIYIYRKPLERDFPTRDELTRQIEITVVHEIAHHFGLDDSALKEYGYE